MAPTAATAALSNHFCIPISARVPPASGVILIVSADEKSFFVNALPTSYGKTGKVSFYGDISGVRGEDLKGQPASARSPVYQPK